MKSGRVIAGALMILGALVLIGPVFTIVACGILALLMYAANQREEERQALDDILHGDDEVAASEIPSTQVQEGAQPRRSTWTKARFVPAFIVLGVLILSGLALRFWPGSGAPLAGESVVDGGDWLMSPGPRGVASTGEAPAPTYRPSPSPPPPPPSDWRVVQVENEFGERTGKMAVSKKIDPLRRGLGVPGFLTWYSTATLMVQDDCQTFIRFGDAIPLSGGMPVLDRVVHVLDVRWDDSPGNITAQLQWGSSDLILGKGVASRLRSHRELAVSVPLSFLGPTVYRWSLVGSAAAIPDSCG